jgi:hypothetical protein
MNFSPKTEEELSKVLPENEYDFEIRTAEECVSKKGNEQIKMQVALWDGDTLLSVVFDYISDAVPWKLRHCADACGILSRYESGTLNAHDFEGRTGKLKLTIQQDEEKKYPPKNSVKDYIKRKEQPKIEPEGKIAPAGEKMPWD